VLFKANPYGSDPYPELGKGRIRKQNKSNQQHCLTNLFFKHLLMDIYSDLPAKQNSPCERAMTATAITAMTTSIMTTMAMIGPAAASVTRKVN
jgi:hypothetical protein